MHETECPHCGGHHHHDDECCDHNHEHHHDGECCDHNHEHHHHDGECCDHNHEHHHHDGECCDHDHHHHHDADEAFTSWGVETPKKFTEDDIKNALAALSDSEKYGNILRAKGILPSADGKWFYFDFVPEESEIRCGKPDYTGKLCVIGAKINKTALSELFGV